jgi:AraC-like DNA-binding protein
MTAERHLILQEKELPPSAEWPPRSDGWLCLRITEGQGYWLQNGTPVRPLAEGDGLMVARQTEGVLRASQLGPLKLHYFTVFPQLLSGVLTLSESYQFEAPAKNSSRQVAAFAATDGIGQKWAALILLPPEDQLSKRCACLHLWSEAVSGLLAPAPVLPQKHDRLRERFRELVGQIPETELAAHSLADLAEQLHCSERHFSRLFREEFGASLRARQIELRLQRAQLLLTNSNAKIINVAFESGYRHLGLFNAMFKKRFGVTPSVWRRQNLQKTFSSRVGTGLARFNASPPMMTAPRKN